MWGNKFSLFVICIGLAHTPSLFAKNLCEVLFYNNSVVNFQESNVLKSIPRYKNLTNLSNFLTDEGIKKINHNIQHSKKENYQIAQALLKKVKERLRQKGIKYYTYFLEEDNTEYTSQFSRIIGKKKLEMVVIPPSNSSLLGRLAKFLDKKLPGFKLTYNPLIDYELYFGGYIEIEKNHMGLPIYMFEKFNPKEEAILFHEIRHFLNDVDIYIKGKQLFPSILFTASKDHLLEIDDTTYNRELSFDEVFGYFESIRFENIFIRSSIREGNIELARAKLEDLKSNSYTIIKINKFLDKKIHFLLRNLTPEHFDTAKIETHFNRRFAKILFESENYTIQIPLIGENLNSVEQYTAYVKILEQALSINHHYYNIAKVTYNEIKDMDLRSKTKLHNKLKALMSTYRKWNFKYADNIPLTRDEVEEIFEKELEHIKNSKK